MVARIQPPTSDKDINGLVLLASAGCRLFGERMRRETVYVLCGSKITAPGCALHGSPKVPSDRLVIAQKSKLRLTQEVTAALASHSRNHRLGVPVDFFFLRFGRFALGSVLTIA